MEFMFEPGKPDSYRVISQHGVRQAVMPSPTRHNASWDSLLTRDGRLFFSLCSELTTSEYAKLAEYRYDANDIVGHFYVRDLIMPHERYIRDSKFHTSMAERPDGTLIMATHTTDKSPAHPAWMPEAYYASPWEGFPGSTLFTYDPRTKTALNLGIPTPRESVYGAAYDAETDSYFMLGFMRGHLYRYDCSTGQAFDMGQVTERHTYRLFQATDGNIYFTTRSGFLRRILPREKRVEDLGVSLPNSSISRRLARSYLCTAVNGPDGRLYMAGQFHDEISAFDPKTKKLEVLGRFMRPENYFPGIPHNAYVGGMAFDVQGALWYVVCCLRHDRKEDFKPPCALMRWDVLNGKKPEFLGVAGTPERAVTTSVGVFADKSRDILYIVGTNHADEGTDVTAIDLAQFRKSMSERGEVCRDRYIYPGSPEYTAHAANIARTWSIVDANPTVARFAEVIPVRLWNADPAVSAEESPVAGIAVRGGVCHGICAGKSRMAFQVALDGKLLVYRPISECEPEYAKWLEGLVKTDGAEAESMNGLPHYPGRQYKAEVDAQCALSGGRRLVATRDGILSVAYPDGRVFALGPACSHGRVHGLAACPGGTRAYGIAGDDEDLGCVFVYDDETGLRQLGRLATDGWKYGNAASCNLSCCALDEKGEVLVIGAADALGCVYICRL